MTDPFISRKNRAHPDDEDDDAVFDLNDSVSDTPDKFSQLMTKNLVSNMPVEKRPKRVALTSLESFNNDQPNKRNRLNGTTPVKLNCQRDILSLFPLQDEEKTNKIG